MLVFSVTPFKIDQSKNQNRSIDKAQNARRLHGGRKPTETSFTEFCYKSVNLFFEKLISIKVILFLIHKLFR